VAQVTTTTIEQRTDADGTVCVSVAGEVDMQTSHVLAAALRDAICAEDTEHVAVDLSHLTFLDSNGIRELVTARALAADHAVTFYVTDAHNIPRRVLEITGLLPVLTEQAPT
jgi:anti-sigma B factor antagonist